MTKRSEINNRTCDILDLKILGCEKAFDEGERERENKRKKEEEGEPCGWKLVSTVQ